MKKQFLTTKIVEVKEMSRKEYVESRGWKLPEDEKHLADERVFMVYYPDGYVSMCPKERFLEQAYEIENNKIPDELVNNFIKVKDISTERYNGKIMTVMRYELINGFVGIESTSCVDEKNYREDIGEKILTKRLEEKIWFGLGFALGMAQGK